MREGHPQRPISPVRRVEEGGGRLPPLLPRGARARVHRARARATSTGRARTRTARPGVVAIFAGQLLAGTPARRSTATARRPRDFVFVDDVVDAFVRAAETRRRAADQHRHRRRDERARALRRDGPRSSASATSRRNRAPARPGELARSALDPGRAAIHLGWKPWTSLDDGLARTLDWFRARALTATDPASPPTHSRVLRRRMLGVRQRRARSSSRGTGGRGRPT